MRPVRFVHAADLHLEAPFAGVEASDPLVRSALVASNFDAFRRIVDLCIERDAEFLLLAGDVYDNARNFNAQLQFQRETARLDAAGIGVFVVEGNHDPESARPRELRLPGNVHYFSTREVERVVVERDGEVRCAVYGRGYARASEARDLASEFMRSADDAVAIGLLHTNVGGREGYEDYAPASMDGLRAARMDYWALGHIHKPEVLSEAPAIVYAGCPQGRSPKEDGPRGCFVVELSPGHADLEFVPTASVAWHRGTIDVSGVTGVDEVRDALRAACVAVAADAGCPAIVRFDLVGRSDVHAALARGTNLFDLVVDLGGELLCGDPWVSIDRVRDLTASPLDIETLRSSEDFSGDLVRLVDEILADDMKVEALVAEVMAPIESSLGGADLEMSARELVERARDACLDLLEAEDR